MSKKKSEASEITTHGMAKRHQRCHSRGRAGISLGMSRTVRSNAASWTSAMAVKPIATPQIRMLKFCSAELPERQIRKAAMIATGRNSESAK